MRAIHAYAALGLILSAPGTVAAQPEPAFAGRMRDLAQTLQVEQDLANSLKQPDRSGLAALAARIDRQDGAALRWLADGLQSGDKAAREIVLSFGPCETAGVAIRSIAAALGDCRLTAQEKGTAFLTAPRQPGNVYAETVARCEMLSKAPPSPRRIGVACVMAGNCQDDDED